MILSDVDIRKQLASGRVVIDPIADDAIQPSSIDLRVGDQFRVFANSRYPYIDVKQPMEDLTELVKATEDEPFILHPGEFVLGSTLEVVTLPDDLVARLEGKSSLGRLGLLIHSSLPADEEVLFCEQGSTPRMTPIGLIVKEQRRGSVVSFDPETFEVDYQDVTGWYEGPPDRVYEIRLESGRSVRVSGGHNLFTIDRHGELQKVRTLELTVGTKVAIPRRLPEPPRPSRSVDLLDLVPENAYDEVVCQGPGITDLFSRHGEDVAASLRASGRKHVAYYRGRARLPLSVLRQISEAAEEWRGAVEVGFRGSSHTMPAVVVFDTDTAWLLGLYVAEGYRRRGHIVLANTDEAILDRVELILRRWVGTDVYRSEHHVTCSSTLFSSFMSWIGADGHARDKRIPWIVHGWPSDLVEAFLEGFVDGDGSREATRTSLWSGSEALVDGFLTLLPRLGLRASASRRERDSGPAFQISIPHKEHKLLTGVPLPDRLLVDLRVERGLSQKDAARAAGYRRPTDLCNIEKRTGRDAVRLQTLRRLRKAYGATSTRLGQRLDRLIDGGLLWDRVAEVRMLPDLEPVFDLEVRPGRRHIENFVAGSGIFVSNTAGFVDAGWSGNLTLELSNVANLPITIYPGMKIGQLCLFQMTSAAENPYGSKRVGSKYHGQEGPTPSRYYKNFP